MFRHSVQCLRNFKKVMALMGLPVAAKLGRIMVENCYQISKTSTFRLLYPTVNFLSHGQKYSTASEERKSEGGEPQPPFQELTENEKKLKANLDLLNKELEEFKIRNSELDNKYKRALADGENLRVRLTKQIEDAKLFGIQGFCKDLLDVADTLGKATESVPKNEITESNPHLKSLYEGLIMTEAQLHKVFKKHGLQSMNPINEKFDPNQHEALFQQEVEGKKPGTVVVVSKVGYRLHERVVRPALVGVAKA